MWDLHVCVAAAMMNGRCFLGVIDVLQRYDVTKMAERTAKTIAVVGNHGRSGDFGFSVVNPVQCVSSAF